MVPKMEEGDPFRFLNIHSVAKHQKIEGGLFGDIKKVSGKNEK